MMLNGLTGYWRLVRVFVIGCIAAAGALTGPEARAQALQLSGIVIDGKDPIPGVRVREHGKPDFVLTDSEGRFTLNIIEEPVQHYAVTAGKEGWLNGGVMVDPKTSYTTIVLQKVPEVKDDAYDFITPHKSLVDLREDPVELERLRTQSHTGFEEGCNLCHFEPTCYLCHRDLYDQWSTSQHAKGVTNPWTLNLYDGTDAEGNENVGPGFRLDFPDEAGECADCHAPSAAVRAPGHTDLKVVYNRSLAYPTVQDYKTLERMEYEKMAGSVDGAGIHCDFCHKIQHVEVNDHAGVNGSITVNLVAMEEERQARLIKGKFPPIFVYGPYDDVINFTPLPGSSNTSPMVASYNPQYTSSDYCSACHQHKNKHGLPFMDTYQEWKDSPYSAMGIECQDCHMEPDSDGFTFGSFVNGDAEKFWTPIGYRDPTTVKTHGFPGATEELLPNAATLAIDAVVSSGLLTVTVDVRNVNTGHHIPSGITIRNMLLLVTPVLANGDTLRYVGDQRVPSYGGEGDLAEGNYAGYPGKGFALVFGDDAGNTHVMDWQATRIVEDTRIKAREADRSVYSFEVPSDVDRVDIHTDLIYRRAFKPLADLKKWTQKDMDVASDVTTVRPVGQLEVSTPSKGLSLRDRLRSYFD